MIIHFGVQSPLRLLPKKAMYFEPEFEYMKDQVLPNMPYGEGLYFSIKMYLYLKFKNGQNYMCFILHFIQNIICFPIHS